MYAAPGYDVDVLPSWMVDVYATSVMPGVGDANSTDISGCMDNVHDDTGDTSQVTVTECLTDKGAVFTQTIQEYCYGFSCYSPAS